MSADSFGKMKQAKTAFEYPKTPHFAVIIFNKETVTEPDYYPEEHGGHSYNTTRDVNSFEYWYTESKEEWLEYVGLLYLSNKSRSDIAAFSVGHVANIGIKVQVD